MTRHGAGTVVCVILNWNGWQDTLACLDALVLTDWPDLHILVIDNASTNDSVARIRDALPRLGAGVELIESAENGGFASGCNLGIRVALERGADLVWLLNNDTVAPADTLRKLCAGMREPSIGMVGTVLRYAHDPATTQAWGGGSIVRWLGFNRHFVQPTPLDDASYLTFASVLIRTELLRTTGLLDEGFFMYFEDADLCFRARRIGWRFCIAEDTAVLHREGGSGERFPSLRADRVITTSGLRFLHRHGKPARVAQVLFVLSRLVKRLLRADVARTRAVLAGAAAWMRQPKAARAIQGGRA